MKDIYGLAFGTILFFIATGIAEISPSLKIPDFLIGYWCACAYFYGKEYYTKKYTAK